MRSESVFRGRAARWVGRIGLAVAVAAGGVLVGQAPALAHSPYECATMHMPAVGELRLGTIRQIGSHNHNHDIGWTTDRSRFGCPTNWTVGGVLRVRVRFLWRNADGTCSSTTKFDGDLRVFDGVNQTRILATDVLPGTCYRLIWRPTEFMFDHPGTLFWRQT